MVGFGRLVCCGRVGLTLLSLVGTSQPITDGVPEAAGILSAASFEGSAGSHQAFLLRTDKIARFVVASELFDQLSSTSS